MRGRMGRVEKGRVRMEELERARRGVLTVVFRMKVLKFNAHDLV